MTNWLIANSKAGDGNRSADFWIACLEGAGCSGMQLCNLKDHGWMGEVGPDDLVLVAGGDGSVNRAASLCLETGATLAVLPSGTANDFARNLGLPNDPEAVCELVSRGVTRLLDVAEFGDRIFLNVAHVGMGTWPARESSGQDKRRFGRFSYMISLIRKLASRRGFRASIEYEGGSVGGRWLSIAVGTGAFFGGGTKIPQASANDGQLDIVAVRPRALVPVFLLFLAAQVTGRPWRRNRAILQFKSPWCRVTTHKPKTVTADGDVVGKTPLDVTCKPACLKVVCESVVRT